LPAKEADAHAQGDSATQRQLGAWLDGAGKRIGATFAIPAPEAVVRETCDGNGNFVYVRIERSVRLEVDQPEGASTLTLLDFHQNELARMPAGLLTKIQSPIAPKRQTILKGADPPRFFIVGDRYKAEDIQQFWSDATSLVTYWREKFAIFTEQRVADAFSCEALFWPADPIAGNFGTADTSDAEKSRVLEGNEQNLIGYLEAADVAVDQGPFVLVLINSPILRAGAGGLASRQAGTWRAAWMTTHAGANEDWRAVALHELGHSFGLMDEYETPYVLPERTYEPNVCRIGRELPEPWSKMLSAAPDPTYTPIMPSPGVDVGRYLGARYSSKDYERPSPTCLMRTSVDGKQPAQFCPVCTEVIAHRLLHGNP
jgi:hypothetical protein